MRKICHHATTTLIYSVGDVFFHPNEIPVTPRMYFLCHGRLEYLLKNSAKEQSVDAGKWISEATLWAQWRHRGHLKAASDGTLVLLASSKFRDVITVFQYTEFDPKRYGIAFVNHLNQTERSAVSDLSHGLE